ncbi:MAG: hypothetical protein HC836_49290 [Richelia sp. RM2_1_2]|nr:hypothetical protein [Richelia sp. RM1_1_1]NJO65789.1 hypothetical protein [Richelia sp. RM2_1_2]
MPDTTINYTTIDAIKLRLRNRLELNQTAHSAPFGQSLGAKLVQPELFEQIAYQVEAKLNAKLGMLYELPIPPGATQARLILASIVEKFTVAEILAVHYQQSQNAEMGGDLGYGAVIRKEAIQEAQDIGIRFSDPKVASNMMSQDPEPSLILPLVPRIAVIPDTISRNYSTTEIRKSGIEIDWF